MQDLQPSVQRGKIRAGLHRLVDAHGHEIRQAVLATAPGAAPDLERLPAVSGSAAVRARDIHIRQELHVQRDLSRSVAGGAAQFPGVIGKITRLVLAGLRPGCLCVQLSQFIVHTRVGRHCGAHVDADGRRVDQLDLRDAGCLNLHHVERQFLSAADCCQSGHKALQDEGRLSRSRDAGYGCHSAHRYVRAERVNGVELRSLHMNRSPGEQLFLSDPWAHSHGRFSGKIRADHRLRIPLQIFHRALRNHRSAGCAGVGPHFDHPVRVRQDLRVMVHKDHCIAVRRQVVHDAGQSLEIVGMQADRRLVQHIEDARRPVSHRSRQLYALPLTGGERGSCPVQGQVTQSEVHQAHRGVQERLADVDRHRAYGLGK